MSFTWKIIGVLALVVCAFGCEPEEEQKTLDKWRAQAKENPELARQMAAELRAAGVDLGEAGRTIKTNSQGVREDIRIQAPLLVPVTTPKLDQIDASAGVVADQAVKIAAMEHRSLELEANIRRVAEERDDLGARLQKERELREADRKAAAEREAKIKAGYESKLMVLLLALAGVAFAGSVGLLVMGILSKDPATLVAAGVTFLAGGVFTWIGMHLSWVGIGCAVVSALAIGWAVFRWRRQQKTGIRQVAQVGQVVEYLKTKVAPEVRREVFGGPADEGKIPTLMDDDTIEQIDSLRSKGQIKMAPSIAAAVALMAIGLFGVGCTPTPWPDSVLVEADDRAHLPTDVIDQADPDSRFWEVSGK